MLPDFETLIRRIDDFEEKRGRLPVKVFVNPEYNAFLLDNIILPGKGRNVKFNTVPFEVRRDQRQPFVLV